MRKFYEEMMRQMELDMRHSEEVLRRFMQSSAPPDKFWEPLVDIDETDTVVRVRVELAGVRPEELHVEVSRDARTLTVRGVRRDSFGDARDRTTFHQMEIYFGSFERNIPLPAHPEVDRESVQASYRDGFL